MLQRYGVTDDDAFAVGLTCGGILDVFVETVSRRPSPSSATSPPTSRPADRWRVATVVEHPDPARLGRRLSSGRRTPTASDRSGSLGSDRASTTPSPTTPAACWPPAHSETLTYGPDGERRGEGMRVFVAVLRPARRGCWSSAPSTSRPRCARIGTFLGYRVTVCDARPVFATASRFPDADEVVVDWPHRYLAAEAEAGRIDGRTVLCVLTHDPKFDVPLLEVALRLPEVAYVGAMGSRRTHDDRLERLREAGLTDAELARLSSRRSASTSVPAPRRRPRCRIAAEIVAVQWGGRGQRLHEPRARSTTDAAPEHSEPGRTCPTSPGSGCGICRYPLRREPVAASTITNTSRPHRRRSQR